MKTMNINDFIMEDGLSRARTCDLPLSKKALGGRAEARGPSAYSLTK